MLGRGLRRLEGHEGARGLLRGLLGLGLRLHWLEGRGERVSRRLGRVLHGRLLGLRRGRAGKRVERRGRLLSLGLHRLLWLGLSGCLRQAKATEEVDRRLGSRLLRRLLCGLLLWLCTLHEAEC